MKITGIIVEYNPLHNGHLYHIAETKKRSQCDFLIAVMSGNFVMRGEPAILNKQKRAELALKSGIDLVVELPYPFAVASADLFSFGAISILSALNVDEIYFGSESNDENTLTKIAKIIDSEPFNHNVRSYLNQGLSYPKASELALKSVLKTEVPIHSNDILALQYIRSILKINSNIKYHTIKRMHNQYNDLHFSHESIASATSIRHGLVHHKDIKSFVPDYTFDALHSNHLVTWDELYPYLKYQILTNQKNLHQIHDVNEGLEHQIISSINKYDMFDDFVTSLVSKRYTASKIKRILTHILNNVTKTEVNTTEIKCIRILGLNKQKSDFLKTINCSLPMITNINQYHYPLVEIEERTSLIYHMIDKQKPRKIPIFLD